MINKILSLLQKVLATILIIVCIVIVYLYLDVKYINPGFKGISDKDLSQICILFASLYLLKSLIQGVLLYMSKKNN